MNLNNHIPAPFEKNIVSILHFKIQTFVFAPYFTGRIVCLLIALFAFVGVEAWVPLPRDEAQHVRATFPFVAAWLAVFLTCSDEEKSQMS